jgi:hypothetical protein
MSVSLIRPATPTSLGGVGSRPFAAHNPETPHLGGPRGAGCRDRPEKEYA